GRQGGGQDEVSLNGVIHMIHSIDGPLQVLPGLQVVWLLAQGFLECLYRLLDSPHPCQGKT
ncbi:MAG: hypothetical protein ABSB57_00345, partial [Dehalococcoidia bacterium]